ncbi:MAG: hypothetical protein SH818_12545 [Saprospiraceae bacterium]|nr:hypothetical protein [Saprospiraceae bacterium]
MSIKFLVYSFVITILIYCKSNDKHASKGAETFTLEFPNELIEFKAHPENPVFSGAGIPHWDANIRERGFILFEDERYFLWYTGYRDGKNQSMALGLATSGDGIHWSRHPDNPIFDSLWTEDMMVIKSDSVYYMFAEGRHDIAHLLTSRDKVLWTDKGNLDVRKTDGSPIEPGPYGTPTVWLEDGIWYLYYERNDEGIWLAKSKDMKTWINVRDTPILEKGPEPYDQYGLAMNQVIKYNGNYYGYYHGTAFEDWSEWSTNLAVSPDLIHWKKYPHNPVLMENKSSGILVDNGSEWRLYSMHPEVCMHISSKK